MRKIQLFDEGFPGSRGIPGLGLAPARPRMSAELARLLNGPEPDLRDPLLKLQMRNLAFATASAYFTPMASIVANLGGAVQSLPPTWNFGGKQRTFGGTLALASQVVGTYGLCRLPLFGAIVGITLVTSISLGTSTLAIGDANAAAAYVAAATYTSVDTPVRIGKTSAHLSQLVQGFDATTGKATNYSASQNDPQSAAPESQGFGGLYEDVLVTVAVASLPASGTLAILVDYVLD